MAGPDALTEATGPAPWISPTTDFWQRLEPASAWTGRLLPPYRHGVPVDLGDGEVLVLPVRALPSHADRAVASLIANQASSVVVAALAARMAVLARQFDADAVVGLPTLGMVFAPPVAQALGHTRWVPLGTSRKFWYDEALSAEVRSITTPGPGKRIFLDPNQLPLVRGRRVLMVDDAVSSGRTLGPVWTLLEQLGAEVVGTVVAMKQTQVWRASLGPARADQVSGVFELPQLSLREDGWWPS